MHALPDVKARCAAVGARARRGARGATRRSRRSTRRSTRPPRTRRRATRACSRSSIARPAGSATSSRPGPAAGSTSCSRWSAATTCSRRRTRAIRRSRSRRCCARKPDVILDLSYAGHDSLAAWKQLDVPAVKTGRVVAVDRRPPVRIRRRGSREALAILAMATPAATPIRVILTHHDEYTFFFTEASPFSQWYRVHVHRRRRDVRLRRAVHDARQGDAVRRSPRSRRRSSPPITAAAQGARPQGAATSTTRSGAARASES